MPFWIKMSFTLFILFILLSSLSIGLLCMRVIVHPFPSSYKPHPNEMINLTSIIPHKVVIKFTERPELKTSNFKVIDSDNVRVDNNDLKLISDKTLSVSLDESKLKTGIYTVYWLILPKDDGFLTKGSYIFSIMK